MERFVKNPDVPVEDTLSGDEKTGPMGPVSPFWDVPEYTGILWGICRLLRHVIEW